MNSKERDISIDIMRGIAILVVVLGHSFQSCLGGHQLYIYDIIRNFQMPIFMFISGMGLAFSYPKKISIVLIKEKVIRFLPASLIWGYVLYFLRCWVLEEQINISEIIKVIYASNFWFLRYLLIYQVIIIGTGCIINRIFPSAREWMFYFIPIMVVVLIKVGTYIPVVKYSMSSSLYLWLVAGIIFEKIKSKFPDKIMTLLGIIGSVSVTVLTYFHILNLVYTLGMILIVWWMSNVLSKYQVVSNYMQYIGVRTLPIYAIHHTVLYGPLVSIGFYDRLFGKYNISLLAGVMSLFLLWTAISLIAEHIISKNRMLRKILFAKV